MPRVSPSSPAVPSIEGPLCSVFHSAIELVGRRWTGAIIFVLLQGPARFAGLRAAVPDITDRMLAERLHELEAKGIVKRTVIPESPIRVEYGLTDKGLALGPPLQAISEWAHQWVDAEEARSECQKARAHAAGTDTIDPDAGAAA